MLGIYREVNYSFVATAKKVGVPVAECTVTVRTTTVEGVEGLCGGC